MSAEHPKSLEAKFSMKWATFQALHALTEVLESGAPGKLQMVLLTPTGFIWGRLSDIVTDLKDAVQPVGDPSSSDGANGAMRLVMDLSCIMPIRAELVKQIEQQCPDPKIVDNGACIYLKNATLIPNSGFNVRLHFDQLLVFVDQIVGFSLCDRQSLESQLENSQQ